MLAATRLDNGHRVALKRFNPIIAHDPDMRRRLELEAETLEGLLHPNIVALKGVFQDGDTWGLELAVFFDGKQMLSEGNRSIEMYQLGLKYRF